MVTRACAAARSPDWNGGLGVRPTRALERRWVSGGLPYRRLNLSASSCLRPPQLLAGLGDVAVEPGVGDAEQLLDLAVACDRTVAPVGT